jgi:hypothetical protein
MTLISDEYRDQLLKMRDPSHRPNWGNGGQRHVDTIISIIDTYRIKSLLDYGCGHGMILAKINERLGPKAPALAGYDPGIPERSALPAPAELLVSTDVLEHVEPDLIENVGRHMRQLALRYAYINVHTGPANAKLPDGRNAHLIQKPAEWWQEFLRAHFTTAERVPGYDARRPSFFCVSIADRWL